MVCFFLQYVLRRYYDLVQHPLLHRDISIDLVFPDNSHPKPFACQARIMDDKAALLIRSLYRDNKT